VKLNDRQRPNLLCERVGSHQPLTLFRLLLIAYVAKCLAIHFRATTVSDRNSQVLLITSGLPMQSRSSLQFPAEEFLLARFLPCASGVHPSFNLLAHLCNP
jgi:hypothetical protein